MGSLSFYPIDNGDQFVGEVGTITHHPQTNLLFDQAG